MGANIGVAIPSGQEVGAAYKDAAVTVGQDFSAGREDMAKKFPVNPDTDPYTAAHHIVAQGLGGAANVVGAPLGRYVDRTLDKIFPKTGEDKQKQHR